MPLQSENRDIAESGSAVDKVDNQHFEHPPVDLLGFTLDNVNGANVPVGTKYPATVRVYCPDIRVISRIAVIFEPLNPSERSSYNLSTLKSDIVAYRAMNGVRTRVARVGEIIGKHGIPFEFPKSDIDGIAFQSDDDLPWIEIEMNLAFPGVSGNWTVFYHATSNNKLKQQEWRGYISRVTVAKVDGVEAVHYASGT